MRIGIEYLPAVAHAAGIGRYARELVRALVQLESPPELALFEWGRAERRFAEPSLGLIGARPPVVRRTSRWPRRALPVLARVGFRADRWLGGVDLFHHVRPEPLPIASARQTLAIAELPPHGSPAEAMLREKVRRLDSVLVFSSEYRDRVCATFGLPSARVHRVPVGCDHWRRELAAPPVAEAPPRLLVLGALRNERCPLVVLRAFEALARGGSAAELVFIGRRGNAADAFAAGLAQSAVQSRVRWHAERSEAELAREVGGATALVHLSSDEGTAVTPLEALSLGPAVVASRLPAFVESLGEHALFVDTDEAGREPSRLAETFAHALAIGRDERLRDDRRRFAARFTWTAAARATADVWRSVLDARG